jgi:uncharacterized PurR-regulated membrane protein YhhQ (DUF165 family)
MPETTTRRRLEGAAFLIAFTLCVPLANWLIGNVGTVCVPNGPCLIPVAPGFSGKAITAPSGVLAIGLALILRDLVQRRLGVSWAFLAIMAGAVLSATFAPPSLVIASTAAFLLSETVDLAVFTPLQKRGLVLAAAASSVVGLVVDSIVFLMLAFGSLDYLAGQILGKFWMILLALPMLAWLRQRDERRGIIPA